MNDKELLLDAAKSYGLYIEGWEDDDPYYLVNEDPYDEDSVSEIVCWNPLKYDGDALRLAVRLSLHIEVDATPFWPPGHHDRVSVSDNLLRLSVSKELHGDAYAATRRAIVEVAALIGQKNRVHTNEPSVSPPFKSEDDIPF